MINKKWESQNLQFSFESEEKSDKSEEIMPELSAEENNNVKLPLQADPGGVGGDVGVEAVDPDDQAVSSPPEPSHPVRNKKVKIDLKTSQIKPSEKLEQSSSNDFVVAEEEIPAKPPVHKVGEALIHIWLNFNEVENPSELSINTFLKVWGIN